MTGWDRVNKAWYLESVASDGSRVTQAINKLPFRVGRDGGCDLAVDAREIGRAHV